MENYCNNFFKLETNNDNEKHGEGVHFFLFRLVLVSKFAVINSERKVNINLKLKDLSYSNVIILQDFFLVILSTNHQKNCEDFRDIKNSYLYRCIFKGCNKKNLIIFFLFSDSLEILSMYGLI